MLVRILGKKDIDFTSKKDGSQVTGCKIYVCHPDDYTEGLLTEDFFLGVRPFPDTSWIKPDIFVELTFNRKGHIESIYQVETKTFK